MPRDAVSRTANIERTGRHNPYWLFLKLIIASACAKFKSSGFVNPLGKSAEEIVSSCKQPRLIQTFICNLIIHLIFTQNCVYIYMYIGPVYIWYSRKIVCIYIYMYIGPVYIWYSRKIVYIYMGFFPLRTCRPPPLRNDPPPFFYCKWCAIIWIERWCE